MPRTRTKITFCQISQKISHLEYKVLHNSCSCLILFRVSFYFAAREFRQFESLFFPYRVYFYKVIIYLLTYITYLTLNYR